MATFGGGIGVYGSPMRAEGEVLLLYPGEAPGMFSLQQFVHLYSCLVWFSVCFILQ